MWYAGTSMNYDPEDFVRLMQEVDLQEGLHLNEQCSMRRYSFSAMPNKKPLHKDITLPGCGNDSLFKIPYDTEQGEVDLLQVCAVDDDMGRWPRFRHVIFKDQLPPTRDDEL